MMTFKSSADLSRLQQTDPATLVIEKLADGLFTESQPVTITLMQPDDINPLADLWNAEDVTLDGVVERAGMFLVAMQTEYGYGIVMVIPDEEWLNEHLRKCIEQNLQH